MLKKIQIILTILIVIIAGLQLKSFANTTYTCNLQLVPDKTQIKAGESVILAITVSNIQAGEGIAIYNTIIEYPTDIFEMKVENDTNGKWSSSVIENSLTFTRENYENNSEDQEIGKVVLTAKSDASVGNKTITLKSNEFSGSEGFTVADVSKSIEIISNNTTPDDGEDNPSGDQTPDDGEDNPSGDQTPDDGEDNPSGDQTPDDGEDNPSGDQTPDDGEDNPAGDQTPNDGEENQDGDKKPDDNNNTTKDENKNNTNSNGTTNNNANGNQKPNRLPGAGIVQNYLLGAIICTIAISVGFYIKYRRAY